MPAAHRPLALSRLLVLGALAAAACDVVAEPTPDVPDEPEELIGHCQWQDCSTCPAGSTNQAAPNHYLGHDDWLFNFQNDLRSSYP